jgi:outer membrane lipoprotein-sorting protein
LLFTFLGAPLQAGTNLDDLLQRVESRYSAISDYVITASATAIGGPTSIAPTNGPGEFPAADHILLARFGSALRYQILSPGQSRPFVWITNGQTTWQYRPYVNEYTETPSAPWPEHPGPGRDLPSLEWRYFARFREIKEMASKAKLLKENERRDAVCGAPTIQVELQNGSGLEQETEDLRILAGEALVCQSVVHRQRYSGAGHVSNWTVTRSWVYKQTSAPIDPRLFVFVPPKRAKRVAAFQ